MAVLIGTHEFRNSGSNKNDLVYCGYKSSIVIYSVIVMFMQGFKHCIYRATHPTLIIFCVTFFINIYICIHLMKQRTGGSSAYLNQGT